MADVLLEPYRRAADALRTKDYDVFEQTINEYSNLLDYDKEEPLMKMAIMWPDKRAVRMMLKLGNFRNNKLNYFPDLRGDDAIEPMYAAEYAQQLYDEHNGFVDESELLEIISILNQESSASGGSRRKTRSKKSRKHTSRKQKTKKRSIRRH